MTGQHCEFNNTVSKLFILEKLFVLKSQSKVDKIKL